MADKPEIVLQATGGDMTVGRKIPAYVLGAFDVVLPEGVEQQESDPRVRNGYICRPEGAATGALDVGFVKADVRLDVGARTSSLERVVDAALRRTEGDVFFEQDIGPGGLGGFIPGVDFALGDVVSVQVWGKRLLLPVTAVDFEGSAERGARGVRVHVGGQLISDAAGLAAKTDAVLERIESEKRQRLRAVGVVSVQAAAANVAAAQAGAAAAVADGKAVEAKTAAATADGKAVSAVGKAATAEAKATVANVAAAGADAKAEDALAKWRQQKDALDALQSLQIATVAAQQEWLELSMPLTTGMAAGETYRVEGFAKIDVDNNSTNYRQIRVTNLSNHSLKVVMTGVVGPRRWQEGEENAITGFSSPYLTCAVGDSVSYTAGSNYGARILSATIVLQRVVPRPTW